MTNIYSNITHSKIDKLFSSLRSKSIAIIGDFCLDAYWIIDPLGSEISLETGLSTRAVKLQRYAPGGAGNVANNLKKLGFGGAGGSGSDPVAETRVQKPQNFRRAFGAVSTKHSAGRTRGQRNSNPSLVLYQLKSSKCSPVFRMKTEGHSDLEFL